MMFSRGLAAIGLLLALTSAAWAEKRVALVVGNAAYRHSSALANPVNDARDMAASLGRLGFEVILGTDLDRQAFEQKIRAFGRALEGADVGLFFYAGHGVQVNGVNHLVATDAKLDVVADLDFETIKTELVLTQMERETKTNIVFLDACRDNPLAGRLARSMGTRGLSENSGLAPIKSGLGTFVAFATQPGNVAVDGTGRNSPFTAALKKHIAAAGVSLTDVMIDVRREVVAATRGAQVPWDHSALQGRFYFKGAAGASPKPLPGGAANAIPSQAASEWSTVEKTSLVDLETFLRRHGSSPEADYARARIADLKRTAPPVTRPSAPQATPADPSRQAIPALELNTDRSGGDFADFDLAAADPLLCATRCNQDERCRAWTYVKPGIQSQLARCWLKDQVPNATAGAPFAVSGLRLTFANPMVGTTPLDWCLTFARDCGEPAASAWCRSRGHGQAVRFFARQGAPATATIGDGSACTPGPNQRCDTFATISCADAPR